MEGFVLIFRFLLVCAVLLVILYIVLPDIYGKKEVKSATTLDEIEKETLAILSKKQEIRSVTDQTQAQLDNINQNLRK
jgi:predicted RND superfamily exporter protein